MAVSRGRAINRLALIGQTLQTWYRWKLAPIEADGCASSSSQLLY